MNDEISNEELLEQIDSIVNDVGEIIMDIADSMQDSRCCPSCEETAKSLFRLIEEYGDENAVTDMLERFAYKTGISLNE